MKKIGDKIKELREKEGLLLRQVAAAAEMDPALLSKIERGERMPTKSQVLKIAEYFRIDKEELLVLFLSDKIVYSLKDEEYALKAMKIAEKKMNYQKKDQDV